MRDWRRSRLIAGLVIGVFLLVQLSIPLSRMGDESARRFGWQMFSSASSTPEFVVTTDTGEVEIDVGDFMAMIRADVDIVTLIPPHLCQVVPEARSVTWEEGSYEC